jgi:phosphate transport system substrate-binding protein
MQKSFSLSGRIAGESSPLNGLKNFSMTLDFKKKIAGAYNMSLVTYAIVDKGSSSAKSVQVEAFVKYMLNTCGPQKGAALGYAPISGALLTKANAIAEGIS